MIEVQPEVEMSDGEWLSASYLRVRERDAYESLDPPQSCPCNCKDQPEDEDDHFCLHSFVEPKWIAVAGMREGLIIFICEFCQMHESEHSYEC